MGGEEGGESVVDGLSAIISLHDFKRKIKLGRGIVVKRRKMRKNIRFLFKWECPTIM